jgi:hypothetical protein
MRGLQESCTNGKSIVSEKGLEVLIDDVTSELLFQPTSVTAPMQPKVKHYANKFLKKV